MVTVSPIGHRHATPAPPGRAGLLPQFIAFAALLVAIIAVPPAEGPMLLIPLRADSGTAVRLALASDGQILGAGPLRGSLVVRGDRETMIAAMVPHGILVTATAARICGSRPADAGDRA